MNKNLRMSFNWYPGLQEQYYSFFGTLVCGFLGHITPVVTRRFPHIGVIHLACPRCGSCLEGTVPISEMSSIQEVFDSPPHPNTADEALDVLDRVREAEIQLAFMNSLPAYYENRKNPPPLFYGLLGLVATIVLCLFTIGVIAYWGATLSHQ